ncbi:hypothetical protein JAAARDRAFT_306847 [Jaapia argillacea MUCL 33604]|uniref:DUF6697 domain-containing protein n=1 Tax=Jaapia argillacea MUCL 33604 TaxID=933084 RepID=A0A067PR25_9AGAM|nr:hypothetical protein JAAARDRAFT_306847 [Jaapia argillacea MUCL 33604]
MISHNVLDREFASESKGYPSSKAIYVQTPQGTFREYPQTRIRPKRWNVVFAPSELSSYLPSKAGDSGLIFAIGPKALSLKVGTLFVGVTPSPLYEYRGDGIFTRSKQPLTPEEFTRLPGKVQNAWARHILTSRGCELHMGMYARIYIRKKYPRAKHDTKGIEDDLVKRVGRLSTSPQGRLLQPKGVVDALKRGDEISGPSSALGSTVALRNRCVKTCSWTGGDIWSHRKNQMAAIPVLIPTMLRPKLTRGRTRVPRTPRVSEMFPVSSLHSYSRTSELGNYIFSLCPTS